ncbi:uncharacterized protein [Atheta coriaria]|uniref:uncharacterized protein n=1 Tax=Dalotia coriaria TaxID=877792 RepID=UPI0031F4009A
MDPINNVFNIPLELWTKIFTYLPRRDRFVCMCVCPRWREAMDVPSLWKHMIVRLDTDFFEVSTIQLTIEFCKYIKSLELRFEYSDEPIQWINHKMLDITKRTYRFLSIFVNKNRQIKKLIFNNFCVFYKAKKILYYLTMFLRSQCKIRVISFNGSFFTKKSFIKLLTSSLSTNNKSIEYLDMQNCYCESEYLTMPNQFNVLASQLIICITSIEHLLVLRIDFQSMINNNVLNGILNHGCKHLEHLDIRIADHDLINVSNSKLYHNSIWLNLKKKLPFLKVSMIFYNIVYEYSCIDNILTRSIPLFSIAWVSDGFLLKDVVQNSFRKYSNSIEFVKLVMKEYYLNEFIQFAVQECPKLRWMELSGRIFNVRGLQQYLLEANFRGFKNFDIYVRSIEQSDEITISCDRVFKSSVKRSLLSNCGGCN